MFYVSRNFEEDFKGTWTQKKLSEHQEPCKGGFREKYAKFSKTTHYTLLLDILLI